MSEVPPPGLNWVTIEVDPREYGLERAYDTPYFSGCKVIASVYTPETPKESNLEKARAHLTRAAKHWRNAETTASLQGDIGTHVNEMRQGARETREALEALNRHLEEVE